MSPKIGKSPQAFRDLDDIATFIGLDNPQAAIRFLELLEAKFSLLAASPGIGRPSPELATGLRAFPADDYMIFYREASQGIEVVRVLHSARDIQALFHDS